MARRPDIEKYCLNCGQYLSRKRFNGRIEDYAAYLRRAYCDQRCFLEKLHNPDKSPAPPNLDSKPKTEPPAPLVPLPPASPLVVSAPEIPENGELTPEEYLLKVMNDHTLSAGRRDQAARILITAKAKAPATTVKSKKEERATAAASVATGGKFARNTPPKVVGRIGE